MIPSVVLLDHGCGLDPALLARVAAALQRQADEHLGAPPPSGWGVRATVRAATAELPIRDSEWEIGAFTHPDQAGMLGYHDTTPAGQPCSKIFPLLDTSDGVDWSVTASHELCELLVDPLLALCFQAPDGQIWAGEVCDAVEQDYYLIDGIAVSNFVRPTYFQPPKQAPVCGFDFMARVKYPLEIRAGGYGQTFDPRSGWSMHDAGQRSARRLASTARSRTARRRYPVR